MYVDVHRKCLYELVFTQRNCKHLKNFKNVKTNAAAFVIIVFIVVVVPAKC